MHEPSTCIALTSLLSLVDFSSCAWTWFGWSKSNDHLYSKNTCLRGNISLDRALRCQAVDPAFKAAAETTDPPAINDVLPEITGQAREAATIPAALSAEYSFAGENNGILFCYNIIIKGKADLFNTSTMNSLKAHIFVATIPEISLW